MDLKKGTREQAIKTLINLWLSLDQLSCASCGVDYYKGDAPCCDRRFICTNRVALKQFYEELREVRETRANNYASNKDRTMRLGVSIPANLYTFLDMSLNKMYGERLFTEEYDMQWFAKKFPAFQVPQSL